MDNPVGITTESAAALDYKAIYTMLQETIDFKYCNSHIIGNGFLKIILAELEYWHQRAEDLDYWRSLAQRLLKEKVNG